MKQPIRHPELGAKLERMRNDRIRQNRICSLRHIAQVTGVDYAHVNRVFHGQSLPSREILVKLCKAMGCTSQEAAEIFSTTDYRTPSQEELDEEYVDTRKRKIAA